MPSEVLTFQTNINQVKGVVVQTRSTLAATITALGIAKNALTALDKIGNNADRLEMIASGLQDGLFLISKISGPLGPIATTLKTVIKFVENRAENIRNAAEDAEPDNLSTIINLISAQKLILQGEQALLEQSYVELDSVRAGLKDTVAVVENTIGMDIPSEFDGAIAAAEFAVSGVNAGYVDVIAAINAVNSARAALDTAVDTVLAPGREILSAMETVASVLGSVDFLSGPVAVLRDILSPVRWALDAIGVVYDLTVGLVVNPVIDALGVTDLFAGLINELGLPTVDIFPNFANPLDAFLDQLEEQLVNPLIAAKDNFLDMVIGDDLLGAVNQDPDNMSNLVIGDDDNPPPNEDNPGTLLNALDGDDFVAGGLGDDTLNGGAGNDLLIGGFGDDEIDGGAGFDGVVLFGEFREYRFSYDASGALLATHELFGSGGNQGTDRISNVEKVIFSDQTFDIDAFENFFFATDENGEEVNGSPAGAAVQDDYLFGGPGQDTLNGLDGNDYLESRGQPDILFGGDGDDTLTYARAHYGGAGTDTVTFEQSTLDQVFVALTDDAARIPFNQFEVFDSIENLTGGNAGIGDYWFYGDDGVNILTGGGGADRLVGFGGNDVLIGGAGKDQLVGGAGDDFVAGGSSKDLYIGGLGNDTYEEINASAKDILWYGGEKEFDEIGWTFPPYNTLPINTSEFSDSSFARLRLLGFLPEDFTTQIPQSVIIDVGAGTVQKFDAAGLSVGNDTFTGIATLYGSEGNDTLYGAAEQTQLHGGGGNDVFFGVDQDPEQITGNMYGDAGNDTFTPATGYTTIDGGMGNDTLLMSGDARVGFGGGAGTDTADFTGSARAWDIDLSRTTGDAEGFSPGAARDAVTGEYPEVSVSTLRDVEIVRGSQFDDILRGHDTAVSLYGGAGNDALYAGTSGTPDLLEGEAGDDLLFGSDSREIMRGGEGNDRFWDTLNAPSFNADPSGNRDSIDGQGGNDTFYVSQYFASAEHFFNGNTGFDTVDFTSLLAAKALDLSTSTRIINVEQLRGTAYADEFTGTDGTNILIGWDGSDVLKGLGGNDTIYTGRGNDIADGGAGNDRIYVALGDNKIYGGAGIDTVSFDAHQTGEEVQTTAGWTPEETLTSVQVDLQTGIAGVTWENPELSEPDFYQTTLANVENLFGTWSDDVLRGDGQNNIISGGLKAGNDLLEGRDGDDILSGGDGDDVLHGDFATPGASAALQDVTAVNFNVGTENQQAAELTGYSMPSQDVTVELLFRWNGVEIPTSYMSFFSYAAGAPVDQEEFLIFGYAALADQDIGVRINGTNILSGVATATLFDGAVHRLSASYTASTGAVALHLNGAEIASGTTNAGGLAQNGRILIAQDQDSDGIMRPVKTMHGEVADIRIWNEVRSESEIDALAFTQLEDPNSETTLVTNWRGDADDASLMPDAKGGAALQLLNGPVLTSMSAGDDTLDGGAGNDTLNGGDGSDTASYASAGAGVYADLRYNDRDVGGGQGTDLFVSIENLSGSAFDDRLNGDSANNTLQGGDGNDILKGFGGDDTFFGGDGDDRILGSDGDDTLHGGEGDDIIFALSGFDELEGGAGRDTLFGGRDADIVRGGAGDDKVWGNLGNDVVFGDAGMDDLRGGGANDDLHGGADDDFLFGENGQDTLSGGSGNDALSGGYGAGNLDGLRDVFVFAPVSSGGGGFDRIKDWEDGIDAIDLSAFGFTDFANEVATLATDRPNGLRIDFGAGDVLFVEGFLKDSFDASDVLLM